MGSGAFWDFKLSLHCKQVLMGKNVQAITFTSLSAEGRVGIGRVYEQESDRQKGE